VRRAVATLAAIAVAALLAASATTATAGAAAPRTTLNTVESEVMCVSCGVPLSIAESPQATAERKEITDLIKQGKTKDEIKAELVTTYGNRVLASPKDSGFGLAAYLVPIAIALIAGAALALLLPRWRRSRASDDGTLAAAGPALTDADSRRLEEDLARYDV
jgi:cytochrome c-type biogenesis protein CcmH